MGVLYAGLIWWELLRVRIACVWDVCTSWNVITFGIPYSNNAKKQYYVHEFKKMKLVPREGPHK